MVAKNSMLSRMWHVLEHVPDLIETITHIKESLKSEGVLIIAVPNHKSFDANHYGEFWAAYDVPRHLWHFSRKAMRGLNVEKQFDCRRNLTYEV